MLRVSYSDTNGGQRWTLCGCLAGPWVDELRSFWRLVHERAPHARAVVDLREVTFVDEAGETLLADMQSAGAEFVACGVENKHLVASLENKAERALRRRVEHLSTSYAEPAMAQEKEKEK